MNSDKVGEPAVRRPVAYLSLLGSTQLQQRNPFVIAGWSMAFPGMGHLLLSKYVRGYILFVWEVIVNYNAHINLMILFSLIGDFDKAKSVVDVGWLSLYLPTYVFAVWDSYRTAVDINKVYRLAAREDAVIKPMKIGGLEINYLDKRKPWVAAGWSALIPGSGQLYIHRLTVGLFFTAWWIVICYFSGFHSCLYYSLLGDFMQAKAAVNMQWFLNIPSVYLFTVYDAYVNSVENNKLFDWEQAKFLKRQYQNSGFVMPLKRTGGG